MIDWEEIAGSLVKEVNRLIDGVSFKMNELLGKLNDKENTSNKKSHLDSTNGDHYPSIPAVNTGLADAIATANGFTADQIQGIIALLADKVDKDGNKKLTDENFTSALKQKLEEMESSKFRGAYNNIGQVIAEYPEGSNQSWHGNEGGWYVDVGVENEDSVRYIWDKNDFIWIESGLAGLTPEQVKQLLLENPDTFVLTQTLLTKLGNIEENAQKNVQTNWGQNDVSKDDYLIGKPTKLSDFQNDSQSDFPSKQWVKDRYDDNVIDWNEAVDLMHSHDNKSVLDGIESTDVTAWGNAATKAHEHANKSVLDGIESIDITAWEDASNKAHEHSNKSVLDGIEEDTITDIQKGVEAKERLDEGIGIRNYIVRSTEEVGKRISLSGSLQNSSNDSTSQYIAIEEGTHYVFSKLTSEVELDGGHFRYSWHDEDKDLIGRAAKSDNIFKWKAPIGSFFLRVSYPIDSYPKVNKGQVITDWTPAPEDKQDDLENSNSIKLNGNKLERAELIGDIEALHNSNETTLNEEIKIDIGKGVTAHDWGDFRGFGLGKSVGIENIVDDRLPIVPTGLYVSGISQTKVMYPRYLAINRGDVMYGLLFASSISDVAVQTGDGEIYKLWHEGNLTKLSELENDLDLSDYIKESDADDKYAPIDGYPDWKQMFLDNLNF